ncbi:BglG family transcription antiterminator [Streptococcus porcinus]|uniref:HTH domain-containing protein n=1 Tax=Streptococcus porcinus TaxID=1340 RepID=A0A7W0ASX8_STRPO|nr:HTH domain-containing protein [Streptococcus porcinus]MBA2796536.1 HTH domain-containing protein [Streptococcus porcinus]
MQLTRREEELLKAFLTYGKLSIDNMSDILKVSKRTVYRVLNELTDSLKPLQIVIHKDDQKYYLSGDLEQLQSFTSQELFTKCERLNLITYHLLINEQGVTNDYLQAILGVSNVTIIQDIALIEERLADFNIPINRQKGYQLGSIPISRRRFLAILLCNTINLSDFYQLQMGYYSLIPKKTLARACQIFQSYQSELPEMDSKLFQFFVFLLALSNWDQIPQEKQQVSKLSLDFSKKVFADLSKELQTFYPLQEILYFARMLDQLVLKRQETPLFQENFDSEFFYNVTNLIDKVALYTKINFTKDPKLFKFLFNHIRLSLAVPLIFADSHTTDLAHQALSHSDYLHRLIKLLVMEIFPQFLRTESELELITLHFASSLRRSPQIYPIRLLLLTDERPLATELLITRLKNIAPFIESIQTKGTDKLSKSDFELFDAVLSTKLLANNQVHLVSTFPSPNELVELEKFLNQVQVSRDFKPRDDIFLPSNLHFKDYFEASQFLLETFTVSYIYNSACFEQTIVEIISDIHQVKDKDYLAHKLIERFHESPMAIPETNLALVHTQSSQVEHSTFMVFELNHPVKAKSMNGQDEVVNRILVMLTRLNESEEIRDLMTAISQSLIENHLYTEIYRKGNYDIIYQLLNQIFTEKIKKLEN